MSFIFIYLQSNISSDAENSLSPNKTFCFALSEAGKKTKHKLTCIKACYKYLTAKPDHFLKPTSAEISDASALSIPDSEPWSPVLPWLTGQRFITSSTRTSLWTLCWCMVCSTKGEYLQSLKNSNLNLARVTTTHCLKKIIPFNLHEKDVRLTSIRMKRS